MVLEACEAPAKLVLLFIGSYMEPARLRLCCRQGRFSGASNVKRATTSMYRTMAKEGSDVSGDDPAQLSSLPMQSCLFSNTSLLITLSYCLNISRLDLGRSLRSAAALRHCSFPPYRGPPSFEG